jgi:hypothetical protein
MLLTLSLSLLKTVPIAYPAWQGTEPPVHYDTVSLGEEERD